MRPQVSRHAALLVIVFSVTNCVGCSFPHKGIVYSKQSANWNVTNGSAYDISVVKMAGVKKLAVPASARLESGSAGSDCVIQTRKTQGFMGHPVERSSIVDSRKDMGCAVLRKGDSVLLGTFGEWSCPEGGTSIKTTIIVPAGIEITTQEDLSGPQSIADDGVEDGSWEKLPFTPADKSTMAEMQKRDE